MSRRLSLRRLAALAAERRRRLSALAEPGHDAPPLLDLQLSVSHAYAVEKREEDGFSEELGTGTVDIFNLCKATGLQPPVFDIDAQHFMVTVYRPEFDEQGNRVPIASGEVKANASEVGQKTTEVGQKTTEVGAETPEVGAETPEVGVEMDFNRLLAANRKDFRGTCKKVWQLLAINPDLPQVSIASKLKLPQSSVQSACNALKEIGLLMREGARKNGRWGVKTIPNGESNK